MLYWVHACFPSSHLYDHIHHLKVEHAAEYREIKLVKPKISV
jgi:hypothetical protein